MRTPTALWLAEREPARPTVAVTGTKGKSSTVSLVAAALARGRVAAIACGNIGVPIWDVDPATPAVVALEVSSYQTLDLTTAPPLRALTSLSPYHVDWHGSVEQYYRDKLQLFAVDPGSGARMLAPASDATAVERTKQFPMTYVDPASDARASAPHRRRNAALAAHIVAEFVPAANPAELEIEMLADYPDLPGRLRPVGKVDDVEYVDDALASNRTFNRLIQGFMMLGLVVGVAALGVISARAVVERRQQIGVLRAIGFRQGMVQAVFLIESSFIALTSIVAGTILGLILAENIVRDTAKQPSWANLTLDVPWGTFGVIFLVVYLVALAATVVPAVRASLIRPAVALRYQ